jgi:hypothetical protein
MKLTASQNEKETPSFDVVLNPLSPSRLNWLRQQKKSAREEMARLLAEMDTSKGALK